MAIVGLLIIGLLTTGGAGYLVYRAKYRQADTTPAVSQQNTTSPQMNIDYPVSQGIKGQVFCNDKVDPVPCSTKLEVHLSKSTDPNTNNPGPVRAIETDDQGNFSIELASGTYTITPEHKKEFPIFAPPLPNPVIVRDGVFTEITVNYQALSKSSVN